MLGVAEADLQLEGGFVRVKGAAGMRKSLAELVDANDRRSGASRWRGVASRAARVHRWRRAHRSREPLESSRSTITPCVGTGGTMFRRKPARHTLRAPARPKTSWKRSSRTNLRGDRRAPIAERIDPRRQPRRLPPPGRTLKSGSGDQLFICRCARHEPDPLRSPGAGMRRRTDGSLTRRWREMDSNHRSLATRRGSHLENVESFADARRQAIPQ
jgi:hypothetical protein